MSLYLGSTPIGKVSVLTEESKDITSDATLSSGEQMLEGITAYSKGVKYTGEIPAKTSDDVAVSENTVTIPSGYYSNEVKKSVKSTNVAVPSIEVSSSGLITASTNQSTGYVIGETKSITKQLTTKGAATITPSETQQTINANQYLTGVQTIAAIPSTYIGSAVETQNYYVGDSEPSSSVGSDGDLYFVRG